MYPLALADSNYLARPRLHPTAGQRRSITDGKQDQDPIRRDRDKGDPRKLLVARCKAQMVQLDLRQPRAERALPGDQQAANDFLAQRRLKILRVAENPCDAEWHFALSGPAWFWLTPPRLRGSGAVRLSNFRREISRRLPTCSPSVAARRRLPTINLATPFRAEPGWFTGAPSFRVPIPEPAIACSRGRGSATRGFCEAIGDAGLPNNPSHKPAAIARHD